MVDEIPIEYAKSPFEYVKRGFVSYSKYFLSRTASFSTHHGALKFDFDEAHMMRMIAIASRQHNEVTHPMRAVRSVTGNTFVFHSSSAPSNDGPGTSCAGDFDRQDVKIRGY